MFSTNDKLFDQSTLSNYYIHRPVYNDRIVSTIIKHWEEQNKRKGEGLTIIDVGCGTGQLTKLLKPYGENIIGLDSSSSQISEAKNNEECGINFIEGSCYELPCGNGSVDLITAALCVHWFDLDKFYEEVRRCLKVGGVLAIVSYGCPRLDERNKLREKVRMEASDFIKDTIWDDDKYLGKYSPDAAKWAKKLLPGIKLLYPDNGIRHDDLTLEWSPTISGYLKYVRSTSMYRKWTDDCRDTDPTDIIDQIKQGILDLLGDGYNEESVIHLSMATTVILSSKPKF